MIPAAARGLSTRSGKAAPSKAPARDRSAEKAAARAMSRCEGNSIVSGFNWKFKNLCGKQVLCSKESASNLYIRSQFRYMSDNLGRVISFLEEDELVDPESGDSLFEYEDPGERDPEGVMDYILQTLVDFGQDEYGRKDSLLAKEEDGFDTSFAKVQRITSKKLCADILDLYDFEIDLDKDEIGDKTKVGNLLSGFTDALDPEYEFSRDDGGNHEITYLQGLTEDKVHETIETMYEQHTS